MISLYNDLCAGASASLYIIIIIAAIRNFRKRDTSIRREDGNWTIHRKKFLFPFTDGQQRVLRLFSHFIIVLAKELAQRKIDERS